MIISITPYATTLDAIEKRLTEMGKADSMNTVLKKAINEVAGIGKRQIWKGVHRDYTLKEFTAGDVKKKSRSAGYPSVTLTVKGAPLEVSKYYKHRDNDAEHGAMVKILKVSAMKQLEIRSGNRVYKAFLARMKNGHEGIFQRMPGKTMKGTKREAIKEIMSLSKAKAAEMVYEKSGLYTELQEELVLRLHKHMNAVIGGQG